MNSKNRSTVNSAFRERRDSYSRTNPDHVEDTVSRITRDILRLPLAGQKLLFEGLPREDRVAVAERLRRWPDAARISAKLEEAKRCLDLADSPDGCICVAGKALDLALACTNLGLRGPLGPKLKQLKKLHKDRDAALAEHQVGELATELIAMLPRLRIRNAAAHFISSAPDATHADALSFIAAVGKLAKAEQSRSEVLAKTLEEHYRGRSKTRLGRKAINSGVRS